MAGSLRPGHGPPRAAFAADLQQADIKLAALLDAETATFGRGRSIVGKVGSECVFRVQKGWCARARYLPDGQCQISAVLLPGDYFGVGSLYMADWEDEVVALEEVLVNRICAEELAASMRGDWRLILRLGWELVEDQRNVRNWLVALGRGDAMARLALLLLDLHRRLILAGSIAPDADEIPFPLTQNQIGDVLGLTAVHVNRTLQHFRSSGLITTHRRMVRLDKLAELRRLAFPLLDEVMEVEAKPGFVPSDPFMRGSRAVASTIGSARPAG